MQPDFTALAEQARQMQQRMVSAQKELEQSVVTGNSADGLVTVVASGLGRTLAVRVEAAVFDGRDAPALETAILQAIRAAANNAERLAATRMGPIEISLS
ncbi:YbaB/EbfC family nucleoid-associated protein [Actinoplanes derwentensis]|uniref:Nucleoid-associated protein SAMN04489716_2501 n=1 Tax=Actinoplanes derwentensis TaxID=113562 RepID=A0A1H1XMD1_9ACTN|nr:YbaB/EbfC family nucleoid-associated protein [Actinoplanes derwentensis]GID87749.1 hypothetical protein Ade03nite_66730 [Actinoplanes derwentensis]SDT09876.1 hypothetical protein SAMN04489716_2501 [Actinoplanes derwentensis]